MSNLAYWIAPNGKVIPIDEINHITAIRRNPNLYGLTEKGILDTYKKFKEPVNFEGKAREEIMTNLIVKGWIRCRYFNKDDQWHCQVNKVNKKALENIWEWVTEFFGMGKKGDNIFGRYTPINIMGLSDGKTMSSSVEEIIKGRLFESKNKMSLVKCLKQNELNKQK